MQRKGFNFEGQKIFIGIDVHLKTWSVAIMTKSGLMETYSQESRAEILDAHLRDRYPSGQYYSVYESGFCGFSVHYRLSALGIKNIVVHASDVPTTQKEKVNKRDRVDAKKLAKALKEGSLEAIYVPEAASLPDRDLVRTRSSIVKDISRWKIRIKHLLYRYGITYSGEFINPNKHWNKRFIQWLEQDAVPVANTGREVLLQHLAIYRTLRKQLLDITLRIRKMSINSTYSSNMELLTSVPGVGFHTAIAFLTEIGNVNRFSSERAFASFLGLVPTCHDTGEKERPGNITFRANRHLRNKLIESSWMAIRRDPALSACFGVYCQRMDENDAIIRIAHKLSNRILTVLKRKTKYICEKNIQS